MKGGFMIRVLFSMVIGFLIIECEKEAIEPEVIHLQDERLMGEWYGSIPSIGSRLWITFTASEWKEHREDMSEDSTELTIWDSNGKWYTESNQIFWVKNYIERHTYKYDMKTGKIIEPQIGDPFFNTSEKSPSAGGNFKIISESNMQWYYLGRWCSFQML